MHTGERKVCFIFPKYLRVSLVLFPCLTATCRALRRVYIAEAAHHETRRVDIVSRVAGGVIGVRCAPALSATSSGLLMATPHVRCMDLSFSHDST